MADALNDTRASKIRRFGPLASAANRNWARSSGGDKATDPEQQGLLLSTEVQRSLLHVGMRVRKSVTNGYRTNLEESSGHPFMMALNSPWTNGVPMERTNNKAWPEAANARLNVAKGYGTLNNSVHPTARKRSLEDDALSTSMVSKEPLSDPPNMFSLAKPVTINSKTRTFAVPKSRQPRPIIAEPMDVDMNIYTDENGNFAEAQFLMPE